MNKQEINCIIQELNDYKNIKNVKDKRYVLLKIITCLIKECTDLELESNEYHSDINNGHMGLESVEYQPMAQNNNNQNIDKSTFDQDIDKSTIDQDIDKSKIDQDIDKSTIDKSKIDQDIEIQLYKVRELKRIRAPMEAVKDAVNEFIRLKKIKENMLSVRLMMDTMSQN